MLCIGCFDFAQLPGYNTGMIFATSATMKTTLTLLFSAVCVTVFAQEPRIDDVPVTINDDTRLADEPLVNPETQPEFPGGTEALMQYLMDNITYPDSAINALIQGTVNVQFTIDKNGKVTDVEVIRGIGYGCDEEAVRVISGMPNWIPGIQDGKAVAVRMTMPIRYVLSD